MKEFYFRNNLVARLDGDVLTILGKSRKQLAENDDVALILIFAISSRIPEDCTRTEFLSNTEVREVESNDRD